MLYSVPCAASELLMPVSESTFDRARFVSRLTTRRLGRNLVLRGETGSTNDDAWDALAIGAPDGTVVIADLQTRGRGRLGRSWLTPRGDGLALSMVLHLGCDPEPLATLPLVVGLALVEALLAHGVAADLKWPNDVLLDGQKLAGVLCERRRTGSGVDAVVVGVGVNVSQQASDFPLELEALATSLTRAGHELSREAVAAEFLNHFEPLWTAHVEGDPRAAVRAWTTHARGIGGPVTVRTPAGTVTGIARGVDDDGALRVEGVDGTIVRVLAGDVEPVLPDGAAEPGR